MPALILPSSLGCPGCLGPAVVCTLPCCMFAPKCTHCTSQPCTLGIARHLYSLLWSVTLFHGRVSTASSRCSLCTLMHLGSWLQSFHAVSIETCLACIAGCSPLMPSSQGRLLRSLDCWLPLSPCRSFQESASSVEGDVVPATE